MPPGILRSGQILVRKDLSGGSTGRSPNGRPIPGLDVLGDIEKKDFVVIYYEEDRVAAFLIVHCDKESLLVEEALAHLDPHKAQDIAMEFERLRRPPPGTPNYFEPSR